jgi:hypothetical protein
MSMLVIALVQVSHDVAQYENLAETRHLQGVRIVKPRG